MVLIRKKKKKTPEELEAERQQKELEKAGIQDEFQAKGFELATWVQDHKIPITIGISGVTVALLLWVLISSFSNGSVLKANTQYEVALKAMKDAESATTDKDSKLATALKQFEEISTNYTGTKVDRLASLYAGDLALKANNSKAAIDAYQRALDASSQKDSVRVVAQMGLAAAFEANRETKKALDVIEIILKEGVDMEEPLVLWKAYRLAKDSSDDKKSREFAMQLVDRYKASEYANRVQVAPTVE